MKKLILFFVLLNSLLFSKVLFDGNLVKKNLSKSKCKVFNLKENIKVCQSYNLKLLECKSNCSPLEKKILSIVQDSIIKEYNKSNPEEDLKDWEDVEYTKNLNSDATIELYCQTPTTVTFKITNSGYGGGAHGWYGVDFINIDKKSAKEIKIDNLLIQNGYNKLVAIAQKYYKLSKNIPQNASLSQADDWFEDKFMLTQNYAITKNGLFFVYNQYEIKAYAFGQTEFFLPYRAFLNVINKNSALNFAFNCSKSQEFSFSDKYYDKNYKVDTKLNIEYLNTKKIKATFKFKTNIKAKEGWFSVSMPQFKNAKNIKIVSKKGFDNVAIYKAGSKIYNIQAKKAIKSKYLLIEGSSKKTDKNLELSFIIDNIKVKDLLIDFRVTIKKEKELLRFLEYTNNPTGQQGFKEHRVIIQF